MTLLTHATALDEIAGWNNAQEDGMEQINEVITELREQNAKLVAAILARVDTCVACRAPRYCQPCLDALASVKATVAQ